MDMYGAIILSALVITNHWHYAILMKRKNVKGGRVMLEQPDQMDLQESTVRVDLLHLDPTDPDGGCCCGGHSGGPRCGRHEHGPERPEA